MRTGKEFKSNLERDLKRRKMQEEKEDQQWLEQSSKKSLLDLSSQSQEIEVAPIPIATTQEDDVFEEDDKKLSTIQKVLLLNELGIVDFIQEKYSQLNDTDRARVLSLITGDNHDTIRRCIMDIESGRSNDPYKNEKNLIRVNWKLSMATQGQFSEIKVKGEG